MKKMNLWKLLSAAILVFAATAFTSCVDDNDDKGLPYLEVNPETLAFTLDGVAEGASTFEVKSNRPWTLTLEEGSEWVSFEPKEGRGNATVEVSVPATNEGRIGTLEFQLKNTYGAYLTKTVTIEQGSVVIPELVFKETFGAGVQGENVPVADYTGWDKSGSGASTTSYEGENAQLRTSSSSSSNGGTGSGGANLYFNAAPNFFIVKDITLPAEQLSYTLSFGMYIYGPTSVDQYENIYSAELSADGTTWTKVPFTISGFETSKYWNWGTVAFKLKEYTSKLYLRFSATSGNNRIEDIQLMTGNGGMVVDLENGSVEVDLAVTTNKPMSVTGTGATFSGALNTISGVSEVGFQYAEFSDNLDWSTATKVAADAVALTFKKAVTGLTEGKTYAVRAYATSTESDVFGDVVTFKAEEVVVETTLQGLMAYIKGLDVASSEKSPLSDYVGKSIVGYIAANNEGGNLNKMIVVVDNTGEASSGVLFFGDKYNTVEEYPVGAKITITVTAESVVSNYYGVLEVLDVETVVDKNTTATMVVPEITAEQLNSQEWCYMHVKVKDLTYSGSVGDTWYSGTSSGASRTFTSGDQSFVVRTSKFASFKDAEITTKGPAALLGVPQQNFYNNNTTVQFFPMDAADVAGFSAGALEPGVTTVAASNITETTATVGGELKNAAIADFTAVGVQYMKKPAGAVDWSAATKVAAETKASPWSVALDGLAAATPYVYRAYATPASGAELYGEEKTFATDAASTSDADIWINFTKESVFPAGFPTKKGTYGPETYQFGTGYDFTLFGTKNGTYEQGYYKAYIYEDSQKTDKTYLILGSKDAYMELPAVAGKSLSKVVCSTTNSVAAVEVAVADAAGTIVSGGEAQAWAAQTQAMYTYELSGTAENTKYRILISNAKNAQLTRLELWYTDGGSAAQPSLTPKTASMEFAAAADATGKTQEYTIANADGLTLYATAADATNFKAEVEADGKTVKVTTLTANETAQARTTTVTVYLAATQDGEKKATATINVSQAAPASGSSEITIPELQEMKKGDKVSTSGDKTLKAVVCGDPEGDNFSFGTMYVMTEGATTSGNGIVFYNTNSKEFDVTKYPLGTKLIITLKQNVAAIGEYNGIKQVTGVTDADIATDGTVTVTPITVTPAQLADFVSMPVTVQNASIAAGGVWCTPDKGGVHTFTAGGTDFVVSVNKRAKMFQNVPFAAATGNVTGIGILYSGKGQIAPRNLEDVKAFEVKVPTIVDVAPDNLSWAWDGTASQEVEVTVGGPAGALSVDAAAIAPFTAAIDGTKITVTPPQTANETDADIVKTMTVSIAGGNSMNVTLTQKKKPSGDELTITLDLATNPGLPTSYEDGNYIIGGYTWGGYRLQWNKALILQGSNNGWISTPAVPTMKLVEVKVTAYSGIAKTSKAAIKDAAGNTVSADQVVGKDSPNYPGPYSFVLENSEANTSYRITATSANSQFSKIELVYSK